MLHRRAPVGCCEVSSMTMPLRKDVFFSALVMDNWGQH